jgi:hypothetical protein
MERVYFHGNRIKIWRAKMSTEIATILTIPDECPKDFYSNSAYLERTKEAIETAKSLVHTIDDEGKKKAQSDVAAIRKYVKTTNGFTKTVFDSLTGKVKAWCDGFTMQTKELDQIADGIMDKFSDLERQKITETEELILTALSAARKKVEINDTFITRPELKVTLAGWITPGGVLTKKSNDLVRSIVESEITQQFQYYKRCDTVKIQCLEADINPAFDPDVLGDSMFTKSEDVFLFKLKSLIDLEKERIQKQEERNKAKIEVEKQAAVDKALKDQQVEANKKAIEEADRIKREEFAAQQKALRDAQQQPQALRETASRIEESAARADRRQDAKAEYERAAELRRKADELDKTGTDTPVHSTENNKRLFKESRQELQSDGTRLVTYTIVFQAKVKNTTTNEQFMQMIKKEVECSGRALKAIISEEVK